MGKRGVKGTPESEVQDAVKRMRKRPEHLRSSRTSESWKQFLIDIGVNEDIVNSDSGASFWERVRQQIREDEKPRLQILTDARIKSLRERHNITVEFNRLYRDKSGKFTAKARGNIQIPIYRDAKGHFASVKNI